MAEASNHFRLYSVTRLATVTRIPATARAQREKEVMANLPRAVFNEAALSQYLTTNSGYHEYVEGGAGNSRLN